MDENRQNHDIRDITEPLFGEHTDMTAILSKRSSCGKNGDRHITDAVIQPMDALPCFEEQDKAPVFNDVLCDVEEQVTVRKKVAFPNTPSAQESMLALLRQHIEDGYTLKQVEVVRCAERKLGPGQNQMKHESIQIVVEEDTLLM